MTFDGREFRNALGCFATGVTIITTVTSTGQPVGVTANSFNSVSLDPPLVVFSLDRRAYSLSQFQESRVFAINVLREEQKELSSAFARAGAPKWEGVKFEVWDTGSPILDDTLASFDCRLHATHDGGDHIVFLGNVLRMRAHPEGKPLLYFRGKYMKMGDIH
jgi:flavin reductase (DIM6/NTAB) family NADH-FMN oxidoreductase RutF